MAYHKIPSCLPCNLVHIKKPFFFNINKFVLIYLAKKQKLLTGSYKKDVVNSQISINIFLFAFFYICLLKANVPCWIHTSTSKIKEVGDAYWLLLTPASLNHARTPSKFRSSLSSMRSVKYPFQMGSELKTIKFTK